MNDMVEALAPKNWETDAEAKMKVFHKWYDDVFYKTIHHHHKLEEDLYFPWIETKVKVPKKLAADH